MATVDSPLDALPLGYASFGVLAVVNNVWTWIAVVMAAVSFWRIKVTTIRDDGGHRCGLIQELTASKSEHDSDHLQPQAMAGPMEETATARVKETVVTKTTEVWEPLMCDEGVTKGKLTMYYEVDVDGDGELTPAINYGGGLGDCGEWWERWERVVKMRNGDDDWYRYVDLTVINGSVVRLWDAKRNP